MEVFSLGISSEVMSSLLGAVVGAFVGGFSIYFNDRSKERALQNSALEMFEHIHGVWERVDCDSLRGIESDCSNLLETLIAVRRFMVNSSSNKVRLKFLDYSIVFTELTDKVKRGEYGVVHLYKEKLSSIIQEAR